MAADFTITGQAYERATNDQGQGYSAVVVHFATTGTPSVKGKVEVPQALTSDPVNFAQVVRQKIEMAVAAHKAVAAL